METAPERGPKGKHRWLIASLVFELPRSESGSPFRCEMESTKEINPSDSSEHGSPRLRRARQSQRSHGLWRRGRRLRRLPQAKAGHLTGDPGFGPQTEVQASTTSATGKPQMRHPERRRPLKQAVETGWGTNMAGLYHISTGSGGESQLTIRRLSSRPRLSFRAQRDRGGLRGWRQETPPFSLATLLWCTHTLAI